MKRQTPYTLYQLTSLCLVTSLAAGSLLISPKLALAGTLYSGVAAGDATDTSAILWTRTYNSSLSQGTVSNLTVQVSTDQLFSNISNTFQGVTNPNKDYTLKIDATGLQSGTQYYYRFLSPDGSFSQVGKFKTAPAANELAPVRFGFSGDADGQWRPYPSTQNFNNLNLDYFVFLGDTIYETKNSKSNATADPFTNPTQALADYHRKYLENIQPVTAGGFSSLQTLFASQGNYTLLDNHELGNKQFINGGAPTGTPAGKGADATNPVNDANTTGSFMNKTDGFKALIQAYDDYQPIREKTISAPNDPRTDGTQQLYFAQQWGANSIFINVDDRSYRDIRLKTAAGADDTGVRADNPNRTMLGATQLTWLEQTLLDSQTKNIPWKIIALSSPIDEGGEDSGKSWIGGYRKERNDLLKFIADNQIDNVIFLSTDDHQNRINELTYFADINDPNSRTIIPKTFTIVAGPIGAGGPDGVTNHSFSNIKSLADTISASEQAKGLNPLGLAANFPGLQNVYREGDPNADILRQPVDFYTPDTFNYVTLDISADGKTLSVDTFGINSYAANTFPEPTTAARKILGFQIQRTSVPEPNPILGLLGFGTVFIVQKFRPRRKG